MMSPDSPFANKSLRDFHGSATLMARTLLYPKVSPKKYLEWSLTRVQHHVSVEGVPQGYPRTEGALLWIPRCLK